MHQAPATIKPTTAVVDWQAFAADGEKYMAEEAALKARWEQLHPLCPLADTSQPTPIYFYGPGPNGRIHPHDPPIGTLHFARWRHELAAVEDPGGSGYYHEENPLILSGERIRPTYTTKRHQSAREVNHFRWEKVTADSMNHIRAFPGPKATQAVHDEYLLNQDDFNEMDTKRPKVLVNLNNRLGEDPKNIYPLGYKLLKYWSKVNGYPEWEDGNCLGADPHSPDALTKHLGWFPKRLRIAKAGLGADPQDVVWNEVFHGNLEAKPKEGFVLPKKTWSEDPGKITTLTSSEYPYKSLHVLSLGALKTSLSSPDPDTLDRRNIWLDAQVAQRSRYKFNKPGAASGLDIERLPVVPSANVSTKDVADIELAQKVEVNKTTAKLDIALRKDLEANESTSSENPPRIIEEKNTAEICDESASRGTKITRCDFANEEREAIEARLKELSRNSESGKQGKIPIVIYSAFRSHFLGVPVTQVLEH